MRPRFDIHYLERSTGAVRQERVFAEPFLFWLYNSPWGLAVNELVMKRRPVSRIYAWWQRRSWTRRKVARFVEDFAIDVSELDRDPSQFHSFAQFFLRSIDPARRPVDPDPLTCVAPCDGKVLVFPKVRRGERFAVKRGEFDLDRFLDDPHLAREFDGGSMVVSRLALADYHHFHFPLDGVASPARSIRGHYHAGGPYALRRLIPFYRENHRMITVLQDTAFGKVLMVEVGALTVGSIRQDYRPKQRVGKGARKGCFELGGSTVVLLFEPGRAEIDADLCRATRRGLETYVKMGERIARRAGAR